MVPTETYAYQSPYTMTVTNLTKLAPALLKAQRKIGGAKKGSANPFYKSKYADLGSVMEACKEALNEEGIAVLQPAGTDDTGHYVETILLHESGESMSRRLYLVLNKTDMQQLGSAISYARRYGLQSMVFIPSEDDDGEALMSRTSAHKPTVEAPRSESVSTTPMTTAVSDSKPTTFRRTSKKEDTKPNTSKDDESWT